MIKRKSEIGKLKRNETELTVYYYLTKPMIQDMKRRCPRLERVILTPSTRLSRTAQEEARKNNVLLYTGPSRGARNVYKKQFVDYVKRMNKSGIGLKKISKLTGVPKSTIRYLIHYRKCFDSPPKPLE